MLKLYRKSQTAQLNWIKKHPLQYLALNATVLAAGMLYYQYQDRQLDREIAEAQKLMASL